MRNQIVSTAAAALLALTCAACGGGGGGWSAAKGSDAETPGAASSSPSGTPFPTEAAQSAASAAVLTIGDFPAGWSTSKGQPDDNSTGFQEQLADCLGAPPDLIAGDGAVAHEESPDFESPDGDTTISEKVSVDRMERVDQLFAVLHQSNLTDCMTEALAAYMEEFLANSDDPQAQTATVGDVEVGQLSTGHYGDDTVAVRATVPIEVGGASISGYLDVLYVRHANAVTSLIFEAIYTPVDPQTTAQFTRLATRKMTRQTFPTR